MDLKKVGKFIAENRKEKGYTQEVLGEKLGITSNTLSKWERGINAPDISLLNSISKELDISLEELLCGEKIDKVQQDSNISDDIVDSIKYYTRRTKLKYLKYFSYCIVILIFLFSLFFLINNYNQFKIYKMESKSNKFYIEGHIIYNQERNIIIINNIDIKDKNIGTDQEEKVKYLNVSLMSDNKIIFSSSKNIDSENNRINSFLLNNSFFADESVNSKEEMLVKDVDISSMELFIEYITINDDNKIINIPIKIIKEYSNNKLIY